MKPNFVKCIWLYDKCQRPIIVRNTELIVFCSFLVGNVVQNLRIKICPKIFRNFVKSVPALELEGELHKGQGALGTIRNKLFLYGSVSEPCGGH
jgi:hypothetical protein